MLELFVGSLGVLGVVSAIALVLLAILWFILPFAIFGTKRRLERLIQATDEVRDSLIGIHHELRELRGELAARGR